MEVARSRPLKQFVVIVAHGPYRVGDKIQPTGMYRDVLVKRGLIKEVVDAPDRRAGELFLTDRMVQRPMDEVPLMNRQERKARR